MIWCTACGAADQVDRFCVNCGASTANTEAETAPSSSFEHVAPSQDPWMREAGLGRPPKPPRRRRSWLIAGLACVAVATVATTTVLVLDRTVFDEGKQIIDTRPARTNAAPPASGPPGSTLESPTDPPTDVSGVTPQSPIDAATAGGTAAVAPPAISTPVQTASVTEPMGGPEADIACGQGYIVQVASELDPAAFARRVAEIRAAGTIPANSKWANTSSSCAIFTSQINALVLYAGPFASFADACVARLASPADAFIKETTTAAAGEFRSCLCGATVSQLPTITAVGQQGVWVGELQRLLGSGLDYSVGAINADAATGSPGQWGNYTAETAAAVGRFQRDSSRTVTEQVGADTWGLLQYARCGHE